MNIKNYSKIADLIEKEFPKFRKTVKENFSLTILALLQSQNCSLPEIALNMSKINNAKHNTNLIRLSRFLQSTEFKTEDKEWRMFINFVFNLLEEGDFLTPNGFIPINVDYTSSTDKFLILTASIPFFQRGIPIYFSMRNYPKKKNKINLIKMEQAFIKELAHLLPKNYQYSIVADRGFGNKRFATLCQDNGFAYILRVAKSRSLKIDGKKEKLKNLEGDHDFPEAKLALDEWETRLVSKEAEGQKGKWYIITSLKKAAYQEIIHWYKKRFNIEKMFQDAKSSGFQMESSRITKYSRFKNLLFCLFFAQMLLMFIGNFIEDNLSEIKKKFRLHIGIISAFCD